jgi:hypothetical protein
MQLLAGLEIEPVDHPGDGLRGARMQGLGKRPQRVFAVRGLDQDHPGGVETEAVEPMAVQPAMLAPAIGGHDEDQRISARQARQQRDGKTEDGRERGLGLRHEFMQGAAREAAVREDGIDCGKAEGQGMARPLCRSGQKAA